MKILGIDFTSRPKRSKPITCLNCHLDDKELHVDGLEELTDFDSFQRLLRRSGPWIAGIDFPFGLPRKFLTNAGWPNDWAAYVTHAHSMGRKGFRAALDGYREKRPDGDKEHQRKTDSLAGSISPQKLYGVPVGLMFFEGAPRLLKSKAAIPGLKSGDPLRIVVEAYPGVLARKLIGRRSYKNDRKKNQSKDQAEARLDIMAMICDGQLRDAYGITVNAPQVLAEDPTGDQLDSLLCTIQAAWAYLQGPDNFGMPSDADSLEGWIADPYVCGLIK